MSSDFMILSFCQWLQDTGFSTAIRESTWGFPILGAWHVLSIAWFGGAVVMGDLRRLGVRLPPEIALHLWARIGIAALLATGLLLFAVEPLVCYHSLSFRIKLALLAAIAVNALANNRAVGPVRARVSAGISLALWTGIVFAARGIAFF